jgi:hypothetical protein
MLANADMHKDADAALKESLAAKARLEQYTFQLRGYITDPALDSANNAVNESMNAIQDQLEDLLANIDSMADYVVKNPAESKETYV